MLARCLLKIARLPPAGEAVDLQLLVTPIEPEQGGNICSETWQRNFAGHVLVSTQHHGGPGRLLERMGIVEHSFGLTVVDGGLEYKSQRVAVRLLSLRIPLPRWLAPRVTAREKPGAREDEIEVSVEVRLPWLGLLIAYGGRLAVAGEGQ
jgi:hypothetical protein